MNICIITGSSGLIGSESVAFFTDKFDKIIGVDNNMRQVFFGENASTEWNTQKLVKEISNFEHHAIDIRNIDELEKLFSKHKSDIKLIVHTAAQPSHDWAAREPLTDFTVNANGTLNMLEMTRLHCPEATFIFTSTNKVYGDTPNYLPLIELDKRWEIDESHPYFGMNTGVFRGGCLPGPHHSGTQLHGFLSYLMKCAIAGDKYTVFGYQGKQVRDNIHSWDLVNMFWHFYQNPRQGEVYNAGGGRHSNCSMAEAIEMCEAITGKPMNYEYSETNRIGDHIWWVSDVSKFKAHYPEWTWKYNINDILTQIYQATTQKL